MPAWPALNFRRRIAGLAWLRRPTRLPLLFALDAKLAVAGGFHCMPGCSAINRASGSQAYCGSGCGD